MNIADVRPEEGEADGPAGHDLMCMDRPIKHQFSFTPSISLFVECENEAELDESFHRLSAGGPKPLPRREKMAPIRLAE
jgi:predicted 3-demethylubiquinone-9 3-methyltransferase (glyoxalase superfamily)